MDFFETVNEGHDGDGRQEEVGERREGRDMDKQKRNNVDETSLFEQRFLKKERKARAREP